MKLQMSSLQYNHGLEILKTTNWYETLNSVGDVPMGYKQFVVDNAEQITQILKDRRPTRKWKKRTEGDGVCTRQPPSRLGRKAYSYLMCQMPRMFYCFNRKYLQQYLEEYHNILLTYLDTLKIY